MGEGGMLVLGERGTDIFTTNVNRTLTLSDVIPQLHMRCETEQEQQNISIGHGRRQTEQT
eukprot:3338789-Rhodomonas_salina.2